MKKKLKKSPKNEQQVSGGVTTTGIQVKKIDKDETDTQNADLDGLRDQE